MDTPRIVLVCKSDSRGGAAVVTTRLMMALRSIGVDARMLVAHKGVTDPDIAPYIDYAAPAYRLKASFLAERLKIAIANGFDRATLFQLDTATDGVDISRHPWVKDADAILLNWVNQGMLSLRGIDSLITMGKKVVWTMHDMWNFTGACHHAGTCRRFTAHCGNCPILASHARPNDITRRTLLRKQRLYGQGRITFVAVSQWLADMARHSTLLRDQPLAVIPNAFPIADAPVHTAPADRFTLLFGAARLDDPIKGLPILKEAMTALARLEPEVASRTELVTYGGIKDPAALDGFAVNHRHVGVIAGAEALRQLYADADVVLSTSLYETLPGTLVEGQAYGAIPIAFLRGGQADIIDHTTTGYLVDWADDPVEAGTRIARAIIAAAHLSPEARAAMHTAMRTSVLERFSAPAVARRYLTLLQ